MKKHPLLSAVLVVLVAMGALSAQSGQQAPPVSADYVELGPIEPLGAPIMTALARLNAPSLAAHVGFLASPALEGRALGNRGLDAATEYVAATLTLAAVQPLTGAAGAGVSGYFQSVPLRQITRAAGQLTIEARRGDSSETHDFAAGVDCLFPELAPQRFSAPVVFAGYGIREQAPARDDYQGIDVNGKIVLIAAGLPPGAAWQTPQLVARYASDDPRERYAAKLALAASLGARAVLAFEGDALAAQLASAASKPLPDFFVPFDGEKPSETPLVRISRRAASALLGAGRAIAASGGTSGATSSIESFRSAGPLDGVTAIVRIDGEERLVAARNVLAIVPGSDPKFRDQAVVIGAHVDHLGRSGEQLYPGADDNASGVAALLEMAKAFASSASRPKRTLVFAFWTGEEEGHLGSDYYVRHPAWPLARTSVYLNLDMIGHPWTADEMRKLVKDTALPNGEQFLARVKPTEFLELGLAENSPEVGPVLARAAHATGVALHFDRTSGTSGGSDYRAFARQRVPFVRFFGNYFDGYHEPTDTPDKLDAGQVLKMTRLAFAAAWLLADRP